MINEIVLLPSYKKIILLILFFVILLFSPTVSKMMIVDNGLYYAQTIKWIENFPVVPGLGNLHGRYAFNSHWFLVNAFFSFSFLRGPYTVLNSFVFLLFSFYLILGLPKKINKPWQGLDILRILFLIASFFLLKYALNSAYPDLAVTILTWLICLLGLENNKDRVNLLFIVLGSLVLLTIKLSAWPILLFVLAGVINFAKNDKKKFNYVRYAMYALLIIFPWLLRNIILSGYLIYPLPEIDIFNFTWKIPYQAALAEKNAIIAWARIPYTEMTVVMQKNLKEWFPVWLVNLSIIKKTILAVMILGTGYWFLLVLVNSSRIFKLLNKYKQYIFVWLVCFLGIIYWFISAPDFRFGYGFIIVYCLLLILPLLIVIEEKSRGLFSKIMICLLIVQYFIFVQSSIKDIIKNKYYFYPASYPTAELKIMKIQNKTIYSPKSGQLVWNAPLPATPFLNKGFNFRGEKLADGFYIKK